MLTENELISGEILASNDNEGMGQLIDNLWNEVAKKRSKAMRLFAEGKAQEAQELSAIADNMAKELDKYIKNFSSYQKFLGLINKGRGGKVLPMSVSKALKNEKSSQGNIVQEIPRK